MYKIGRSHVIGSSRHRVVASSRHHVMASSRRRVMYDFGWAGSISTCTKIGKKVRGALYLTGFTCFADVIIVVGKTYSDYRGRPLMDFLFTRDFFQANTLHYAICFEHTKLAVFARRQAQILPRRLEETSANPFDCCVCFSP